jgi:AmmeMemoRadiSam system protein B
MFAGPSSFYPNQPELLREYFETNTCINCNKESVVSAICPHAGYIFSAKTALKTLEHVKIPQTVVIIGPNHTGKGQSLSVMKNGAWEIPGYIIPVNQILAEKLIQHSRYLVDDYLAHQFEHSIEVLVPILHFFNSKISIVPIVMGNYSTNYWEDLQDALYQASLSEDENFLVIASTDMSHFVSRQEAIEKDELVFQKIRTLDASGLMETVKKEKVSICGSGPVAVAISYSKRKGAKQATLIDYTDSGVASGDLEQVVSYAGFIVE